MSQLDLLTYDPERTLRLQTLGFTEDPFSTSSDPRFLYLSPQHNDILEAAQRAVLNRRGLVVVEGPIGIGKSTVARRLEGIFRMYEEKFTTMFFNSGASFQSQYEFLNGIARLCNLKKRKGLTGQWSEIEDYITLQAKSLKDVVIIIDDAEKMDPTVLDAIHRIYNFDVAKKLTQVILFGQLEIREVFRPKPEALDRVYQWYTLHPLSTKDAFNLINFRATVAGRQDQFLSQSGFLKIWEACGGIPRKLVKVCSIIVDQAAAAGNRNIENAVIESAIQQFLAIESIAKRPNGAHENANGSSN
jgi:general secretion pathway protein A